MHVFEDLPNDLILIVEVRESKTHWMQPGDFDVDNMPRTIDGKGVCISGFRRPGFHVGFTDATVWLLRSDTPFEELSKFFRIESAEMHDREEVLGGYRVR